MVVTGLDVVARLPDHQANLSPEAASPRVRLVALPPPYALVEVGGAGYIGARKLALAGLAAALGGGDGPVPVLDLADHNVALFDLLAAEGPPIVLVGAVDQPGWARAVRYMARSVVRGLGPDLGWPGADPLDPGGPVGRPLRPGQRWQDWFVAATGAWVPAGEPRVVVLVGAADGDPACWTAALAASGRTVLALARDDAGEMGPWAGWLPPEGRFGTALGADTRAVWQGWWSQRGRPQGVRQAVLGFDPALEAALACKAAAPAEATAPKHALLVAVTGLDGSGKTTQVQRLVATLAAAGTRAMALKLHRQGPFLRLADELGARTRRGAPLAAFRVSRIVKLCDSLCVLRDELGPALLDCDVVVLDRGPETHLAAAVSQLGWDLGRVPLWMVLPRPDLRFWLQVDSAVALQRLDLRQERRTADEHATGLQGYALAFDALAVGENEFQLNAVESADSLADHIAAAVRAQLTSTSPRSPAGPRDSPRVVAPVPHPKPRTVTVRLDGAVRGPCPGRDLIALRSKLVELGGDPQAMPTAWWLEAWLAQVVLDFRARWPGAEGRTVRLPVWPAALAAMPELADLPMMPELLRMLPDLRPVGSPRPLGRAADEVLGLFSPSEAGLQSLRAAYQGALKRILGQLAP